MDVADVFGHLLVVFLVSDIANHEDAVKTGENSRLEINLIRDLPEVIVFPKQRISSRQHRSPRVQYRCNPCLSNGNRLLLHGLVYSNSVLGSHLVELIYADDTTISKDKCTSFQLELPC